MFCHSGETDGHTGGREDELLRRSDEVDIECRSFTRLPLSSTTTTVNRVRGRVECTSET